MRLPGGVEGMRARGEDWATWVDALPRLAQDLMTEWGLRSDGWMMHGYCSLVIPALDGEDRSVALKITAPIDVESTHEHLALQRWGGDGAVRLLTSDPRRRALLLERLQPIDLRDLWDLEACEVVAGLWPKLHVPAMPALRPLNEYVTRWVDELAESPRGGPVPHRLVQQAVALGRELLLQPADDQVVIHGDLHYYNVMHAERGWVAIDPKPMNGDSHYEVAPMLWNRVDELDGDLRAGIRRRFHALVEAGGLEEDRARAWVVVREVLNAAWSAHDGDDKAVTVALAIAKAVQD